MDNKEKENKVWNIIKNVVLMITVLGVVMSLILSSINIYCQFFWKSSKLKVSVFVTGSSNLENVIPVDVAFMNGGNQSAIITEVSMILPLTTSASGSSNLELIWCKDNHGKSVENIVLKPGEIISEKFYFVFKREKARLNVSQSVGDKPVGIWTDEAESFHSQNDIINFLEKYGKTEFGVIFISTKLQFVVINSAGEKHTVDYEYGNLGIREHSVVSSTLTPKIITLLP